MDNTKYENRSALFKLLFDGGTLYDAFLMEAAQQIGQSLLTIPWIFSLMGYAGAIITLLLFSVLAMWSNHLVISLLTQFRYEIDQQGDPRASMPGYIASYGDVIGWFCGKKLSIFTHIVVILSLLGTSVGQIIATASNLFLLQDPENYAISKRTLTCIVGGIFSLIIFLPTAREFRFFSLLACVTTFYTAWYFTIYSAVSGPVEDVKYEHASSINGFFLGLVNVIFNYGGISATIEKADVMNQRNRYDYAYIFAGLYSYLSESMSVNNYSLLADVMLTHTFHFDVRYTVTLPNGITTYHSFGSLCYSAPNAFYLFPASPPRTVGIILMSLHELVAFGLFAGPLFHLTEKAFKVQNQPLFCGMRLVLRTVLCGIFLLISVMLPYFGKYSSSLHLHLHFRKHILTEMILILSSTGVINGFFAAFATTFGTYIIPTVCYNMAFASYAAEDMQKPIPQAICSVLSMRVIRGINWFIAAAVFVFGVGFGGYSAIASLIQDADTFSLFPECYECN